MMQATRQGDADGAAMATHAGRKIDGGDRSDLALVRRIARQDRDAITELYRRYHARLFKFIFRLTHSYTAADELVNDIMLVIWRNAAGFRGDSRVSTWIFGIAYRLAMHRIRRKQIALAVHVDPDELPSDERRDLETEDWVRRGLDALPAAQQLTMELVFYLGLSYAETAELTDCSVNTVKTRMFHARRKLREYLTVSATESTPMDGKLHE
jgi:RNA polymerase sigma-70 factor (ECF subfamily)